MWKEAVEERFFGTTRGRDIEKLLYELVKAEEEEEAGISLLITDYDHARETKVLTPSEKEKILESLSLLIGESRRHQKLLQDVTDQLRKRVPL